MKAGQYKILKMNHPQIMINNRLAKIGDVFNEKAVIKWQKDGQAMQVIDIDSNKRYVMVAKPTVPKEASMLNLLTRIGHLSTHHEVDTTMQSEFDKLECSIESSYDLFDTIEIPTKITVDESHYFLGTYRYGDARISKRLHHKNGNIIIDKSLFNVDDKKLEPRDIELTINYIIKTISNAVFIKNNIKISIIQEELE